MDVDLLWDKITKVLENMIIAQSEMFAIDKLRRLERIRGEDHIGFVSIAHMIHKLVKPAEREQECVTVFFGKLLTSHQQNILDIFKIEELSFDRLIEYYKQKGRQESFMGLANMKSGMLNAMNATNKQTNERGRKQGC